MRGPHSHSWWILASLTAVPLGILVAARPAAAGAVVAAVVAGALLATPLGRLILVVVMGMAILQSERDSLKVVYVVVVALATVASIVRIPQVLRERPALGLFRPLLTASIATALVVVVSLPVALGQGVSLIEWFRGALPGFMLASAPWVGLDAGFHESRARVLLVFVGTTLVAPLSFMAYFLSRRGESTLGLERLGLTSITLCIALLALALANLVGGGRHRLGWTVVALYVPSAVLLSGTRSGLALFGVFLGLVGSRGKGRLPVPIAVGVMAAALVTVLNVVPFLGSRFTSTEDFYGRRLATLSTLVNESTGNLIDQSLSMRANQTRVVLAAWQEHPVLGLGPGYEYGLTAYDTPVMILGYFGIAGVLIVVATVWAWIRTARQVNDMSDARVEVTALRSFGFGLAAFFPLGSIFDDKGLSLSLALFSALLAARAASEAEAPGRKLAEPVPTAPEKTAPQEEA